MDRPTPLVYGSESPVFTEAVVQSHSGERPEGAEVFSSPDGVDRNYTEFTSRAPEAVAVQTDGRSRKLTEKGLEFQRSIKEKGYQKAMKVLKNTIDALDMVWTDLSDANVLRERRANLEDCRLNLQVAQLDYEPLLSVDEAQYLVNNSRDALRQAQELRSKIGDRIFELEREETRSRQSSRSSSSKRSRGSCASKCSRASHGSDRRQKALAEAARKEIDLKYAKIESQKKMELVARECAMEELQKMKEFERAKAEASVLGKVEAENRSLTMELLDLGTAGEKNEDDHVSRYLSSLPINKQVPVDTMAMPLNPANSVIPVYSASVPLKSDPYVVTSCQEQSKLQQDLNPDTAPFSLLPTKATTFTSYSTQYPLMYGDHIACQGSSPPAEANMTIPFGETSPSRALTDKNSPLEEEITRHHQLGIADAIAEGMQAARLPPPKLTVFDGNPLDWPTWKGAFEIVVEKRAINPSEKILYLMQYLSGAPRKIVEGYQFVSSPDAYEEAKKTLEKRFGHPSVVAEAFRDKLEGWHKIPPRDGTALREFADFLKTCELAMSTVGDLGTLNMQHDNKMLVRVLPSWAHPKWGNKVRDYQLKHGNNTFPPFTAFAKFVADIAEVQCLPVLSGLEHAKPGREVSHGNSRAEFSRRRNHGASSFSTDAREEPLPPVRSDHSCPWCKGSHLLDSCREFMKNSIKDRTKFIIRKGLCLRCLQHGHMAKDNRCTTELQCAVCTQRHPTCLHKYTKDSRHGPSATNAPNEQADKASTHCVNVCSIEGQASGQDQSLILPVWVSNSENPREETLTYALIDCQSNATFITERLRRDLNANGVESQLLLSTMHGENEKVDCRKVRGLNVSDFEHQVSFPLPKVFTRDVIPYSASQVPKPEVALQWSHLKNIANKLMPFRADIEVGLLIGTDCPKAIKPREVIPGADQDPYGIRTDLGWGIIGRVCQSSVEDDDENTIWTNKIVTREVTFVSGGDPKSIHNTTFAFESQAKEIFNPTQVKEMLELDFHERAQHKDERALSVEDRRFLDILERGIHRREDGHYEMPLPLRSEDVRLPNNLPQALRRLSSLRARLEKDPKYLQDYVEFMEKVIRDCAEKVPALDACDVSSPVGKINYLAHHGVYHPKKPEKIRVVFDCSARYKGTSLNQNLLHGPDLTNSLVGVLCRFRQESVAFSCDIEAMFHQFFVNEEDRDMLRFLWWEGGDLERTPSEYRMKVHPFGAGSSPGCANFGLKRAADDGEEEFGPDAADLVRRNFYVDDGLKSVGTTSTAITLIQNCRAICSRAALRLHKFTSNSKEVIHAVSPEDRAKGLQDLDLRSDPLPMERPLGIMWCVETDCFQFRIVLQDRPFTRRGVLSTVSSIYDPLGLVAPLILVGKQILQDLCREGADWDDPIPDDLRQRWEQWRSELHELESLKIQRCFKPGNLGEIKRVELHHFSDASQKGYGQCSYVRLIDEQNKIHCTLVMGKARVTPLKPVTIPRLELTAAVVSVRVSQWLNRELDFRDVVDVFWTDSRVVLGYISNEARRFHIFVANRVQEIHDHTDPKQWFYIETKSNPADAASRGLTAHQLVNESSWLRGPRFLWKPDEQKTPVQPNSLTTAPDDPEVKKVVTLATHSADSFPGRFETSRLDRFSEWHRAKRAVAVCLRFKDLLKKREVKKFPSVKIKSKMDKGPSQYQRVGLDELQRAELEIVREVQREHFKQEIKTLSSLKAKGEFVDRTSARQRNEGLKKSSSIYRLDPFLDEDGILRVGGRLRRANMSQGIKHPVILPRRSHITELVIRHSHQAIKHQGRGMTHNELRQRGYWVIGGSSAVSNLIFECIPCRRLRAPVQQQKMADLPEDRMEPAPPFTYCAVDYFGPFLIKEGRKELKRYGVLFTCMASRAVHVETANTLETDSFVNALRRFLAERGPVRQMRSDRGTNFVGAKRELGEALKEIDQSRVRDVLLKENCDWVEFKLNVPHASHMGGVWERQIRTVRSVLAALLEETGRQLDDESFRTLLKEVQNIVNSRPLTSTSFTSPDAPEPLTPNHLLTSKTKVLLPPPGIFQREDLYLRKRWRRVQHLANEFWKRWRREFLQTLQARQKWIKPRRNLQVDDVVLMKDEHTARNEWKLARVEETFPSDDGLVRKVKLAMATSRLDSQGRRLHEVQHLERPVQKLVLLQAQEDRR